MQQNNYNHNLPEGFCSFDFLTSVITLELRVQKLVEGRDSSERNNIHLME